MMNLFVETEGRLTPAATKSHLTFCFTIGKPIKRLNLAFSYTPKQLLNSELAIALLQDSLPRYLELGEPVNPESWKKFLPLNNLLTISLDDPAGFRGAAHRHPPEQQLFVAEEEASPGLIPGKLLPGLWRVTISVHAIVTNECEYRLRVWEGEDGNCK